MVRANRKQRTRNLGFGLLVDAPLVLPLRSNLVPIKGFSPVNEFDGVNDYIDTDYIFDGTNSLVFESDFIGDGTAGFLFDMRDASNDGFLIEYSGVNIKVSYNVAESSDIPITSGVEYNIKVVCDGTNMKTYIDNVLKSTTDISSEGNISVTNKAKIGCRNFSTASSFFASQIDYVKLYEDSTETTLKMHLDLKNNASYGKDQVKDLSGNGNHGTSYGKGEFSRSTDGTFIDNNGVIQTAGIDIARFEGARWDSVNKVFSEYDTSGNRIPSDTLKGLMSYEGATNLLTYSEEFSLGWGIGSNTTITTNQIISPDGTITADRIEMPTLSSTYIRQQNVLSASTTYTCSVYAKSNGSNNKFQLDLGDFKSDTFETTDEWVRYEFTTTTNSIISINQFAIINGDDSFATDIYIWGAQLEESSFATPYIKTTSTTASTTADIHKQDVTDIPNFTQGKGSIYAEFNCDGANDSATPYIFALSDGTTDNFIGIYGDEATQEIIATIVTGGVEQASITTSDDKFTYNVQHKAEITYEDDNVVFYLDGVKIGECTSATIPTGLTTLYSGNRNGSNQLNGTTKDVNYKSTIDSETEAIRRI